MLRSLLVPLDGTRFSERALPLAEGIAQATGASLHLAHVHVPHPPEELLGSPHFQWEGGDLDEYDRHDCRDECAYLDEVARRVMTGSTTKVDTALLHGEIQESLTDYAARVKADVVVLTTHCRRGLERAWKGSIADALVRAGDLPVLAIHPDQAESAEPLSVKNVLVPLDGSGTAESILPYALEMAQAFQARVTLLQVVSAGFPGPAGTAPPLFEQSARALQEGEEYLGLIYRRVRRRGLDADTMVIAHAHPGQAIVDVAREVGADVIAMATHGYSGVKRVLLGSITGEVLRTCGRPVLIKTPPGFRA